MAAPDPDQVDCLVRKILALDARTPGFARALVAALVAKLGPGILKPAPRSSEGVDITTLIN